MEKYCISLEQAKKLVELGFKAEHSCAWYKEGWETDYYCDYLDASYGLDGETPRSCKDQLPAYHVGELGEVLKDNAVIFLECGIEYDDPTWNAFKAGYLIGKYPTEAQSRGALIIYLLENNLI